MVIILCLKLIQLAHLMALQGADQCGVASCERTCRCPESYPSGHIWTRRLLRRSFAVAIARQCRKPKHLRNRTAMNTKPLCGLPAAQPVHNHRISYPHRAPLEDPSSPPIPFKGIEAAFVH